jgi:hypothetical protein
LAKKAKVQFLVLLIHYGSTLKRIDRLLGCDFVPFSSSPPGHLPQLDPNNIKSVANLQKEMKEKEQAEKASQGTAPAIHSTTTKAASLEELKQRLQQRIAQLRQNRGGQGKSRQYLSH